MVDKSVLIFRNLKQAELTEVSVVEEEALSVVEEVAVVEDLAAAVEVLTAKTKLENQDQFQDMKDKEKCFDYF